MIGDSVIRGSFAVKLQTFKQKRAFVIIKSVKFPLTIYAFEYLPFRWEGWPLCVQNSGEHIPFWEIKHFWLSGRSTQHLSQQAVTLTTIGIILSINTSTCRWGNMFYIKFFAILDIFEVTCHVLTKKKKSTLNFAVQSKKETHENQIPNANILSGENYHRIHQVKILCFLYLLRTYCLAQKNNSVIMR